MRVVKSPVEHADEHALAVKRLRQVVPSMHAVDARAISGSVHVWDGTRRQFDQIHRQVGKRLEVLGVHSERGDAGATCSGN